MESLKGTKEPLDILDQEVSQQERDFGSADFTGVHEETPWWAKYAKPEVMRQRILLRVNPNTPSLQSNGRRSQTIHANFDDRKKENYRLLNAYEAQESRQNADKVQSPSNFKWNRD